MIAAMTTEAKWTARVTAWRASGQTARVFCDGKEYTANGLRYWSSRLRKLHVEVAAGGKAEATEIRIARLVRVPAVVEHETPIVIEVGSVRVGVRRGFDRGALHEVLEALGGAR
jgi:hypothetical protein